MLSTVSHSGGESHEDQISDARSERAGHEAIRQHQLQCHAYSASCQSLRIPSVVAVDLIGHSQTEATFMFVYFW